jgi:hypothetical protein
MAVARRRRMPRMVALLQLLVLVVLLRPLAAAHGHGGPGFVPAPAPSKSSRWAGGRRHGGITASSLHEPPPSLSPRFGEDGGSGSGPSSGLGAVLSSLAKQQQQQHQYGAGAPGQKGQAQHQQEEQRDRVLASTPQPFSLETAVLLAPFAFEAYNDPPRTEGKGKCTPPWCDPQGNGRIDPIEAVTGSID